MNIKKLHIIISVGLVFVLSSCSYWIAPSYTNVEKITKIKPGMTIDQVNSTLGISPYNIYHIQDDGGSILTYTYRIKNRRMIVPARMKKQMEVRASEEAQTTGAPWYDGEEHIIYVLFKDQKVKSLISDEGLKKSEYLLLKDNNLRIITKKEYNSLRRLDLGGNTNLLVLNEKNVIQSIDLPKEKVDESNTIIVDESKLTQKQQANLQKSKNNKEKSQSNKGKVVKKIVVGYLGLVALIMIIALAAG